MNFLERIKKIAEHISDFFNKLPSDIRKYAKVANEITGKIKAALPNLIETLHSKEVDFILAFIPGDWDSQLRDEAVLAIQGFGKVIDVIFKATELTEEEKFDAVSKQINGVASKLIAIQDGKQLPENRYDTYAQLSYSASKS